MRLRSVFALSPDGSNLEDALGSDADAILATVAHSAIPVDDARAAAVTAVNRAREAGKLAFASVNHPRTQLLRADIETLVSPNLSGVFISNALEPQDVRDTAVLLREFELQRNIEIGEIAIVPVIGSARGLLRAPEIVAAAQRVAGLVFDGDLYARDVSARPEERGERFAYARGAIVAAARAVDRLPLAVANGFDVRDLGNYGFAGVVVSEPRAAASASVVFVTLEIERRRANNLIAAYEAARGEGAWVARVDDEVADASAVRRARQALEY
jgi:citrate lyase subunit beta/citryl-CoA lyase